MDAQITHPAAPYYAISTNIASTPLGTARSREVAKHAKYDKQAKKEGASFYPLLWKHMEDLVESQCFNTKDI